jgi:hypothetical protein
LQIYSIRDILNTGLPDSVFLVCLYFGQILNLVNWRDRRKSKQCNFPVTMHPTCIVYSNIRARTLQCLDDIHALQVYSISTRIGAFLLQSLAFIAWKTLLPRTLILRIGTRLHTYSARKHLRRSSRQKFVRRTATRAPATRPALANASDISSPRMPKMTRMQNLESRGRLISPAISKKWTMRSQIGPSLMSGA